jgi:predicted MFS family arabinose efflux permease
MLALISFFSLSYDTLLPAYAKVIFKGDVDTYGYIRSFIGLGAICGTIFLASLKRGTNLKIILLINTFLLGIGLVLFSHCTNYALAMFFAVIFGFGGMSQNTICITMIQVNADAKMRGRMISYVAMSLFGMLPLGSLLAGTLSKHVNETNLLLCQGIMAIIIAACFSKFLVKESFGKKKNEDFEEAELGVEQKI